MSTGEHLPLGPSIAVCRHFSHMELLLTTIVAGLLVGLVYCLIKVRMPEPVLALIALAVMLLGQVTPSLYPFGIGLLLGLAYDSFEKEWYGSAIADSARASYRLRLFLKRSIVGWVSRCLWSGRVADRASVKRLRRRARLAAPWDWTRDKMIDISSAILEARTGGVQCEHTTGEPLVEASAPRPVKGWPPLVGP
jgi:xanthosine utilization system XapX-like protein